MLKFFKPVRIYLSDLYEKMSGASIGVAVGMEFYDRDEPYWFDSDTQAVNSSFSRNWD